MIKILLGLSLGLMIGAGCRYADIPVPSPPSIIGALLVVSITLGYVSMDRFLANRPDSPLLAPVDAPLTETGLGAPEREPGRDE